MTRTAVRPRAALLASVAGAMIVALDGTVLLVAQPDLRDDLGATVTEVQWTSTAYLLAVAALLVIAGRLGDRYGHRRLLCVGVLGFGAASAGVALAQGIGLVIALRAAQGVFGALLQPATLALLRLVYPADRLGRAVALRTSAIGAAAAAGPVLGGVLVTHWGWRAVFLINIPAALAIAALTLAVRTPEVPRAGHQRFDLTAGVLLAAALAALVHTLAGIPDQGWTGHRTGLGLLLSMLLGAGLVGYERRSAQPVVPSAVTRSVPVTASMALLLTTSGGLFGALFVVTFFLQQGLGLDPLATGLRCLPLTLLMIAGAPAASAALGRFGPRRTAITGQLCVVVAVLGLSRPGPSWETGLVLAVLGAGFTAVMVTATGTVVGDAPPGYAGVAGGLKQTAMNVGTALGIAVAAGLMPRTPPAVAGPGHRLLPVAEFAPGQALPAVAVLAALGLIPASLLPRGALARTPARLVGPGDRQ
ncbi:MFS transporter [Streptomyces sp. 130]|uniref:MFS transporter n=1 Tax=Streptomyces sp. 130 TaxID=2591006 RepID=UPI00117EEE4A|nr:MFS transporter [Streptomyces sp. 130]TRV81098.1 MFS transporter [Streptomyces sp. 130]